MPNHSPNWMETERRYFINVILPKSQKPVFGSDEHDPKGYSWDNLAEIMQAGMDLIYANKPPFETPRQYSRSVLSQHWRKRCGMLARETGQLDEFGPTSPVTSRITGDSPPNRVPRGQTTAPTRSKKRAYQTTVEDDEASGDTDEEEVFVNQDYFGNGEDDDEFISTSSQQQSQLKKAKRIAARSDENVDDDDFVPMRSERQNQLKKATNMAASSSENGSRVGRRLAGGYSDSMSKELSRYHPNYSEPARTPNHRPYSGGREEARRIMNQGSIRFSAHYSEQASSREVRPYSQSRGDSRHGFGQINQTDEISGPLNPKYSDPARIAGVGGTKESRRESGGVNLTGQNSILSHSQYSEPAPARKVRIHIPGQADPSREHGPFNNENANASAPRSLTLERARVLGGRASTVVRPGDSRFGTTDARSKAFKEQNNRNTYEAKELGAYKSPKYQTTTNQEKLKELLPPEFRPSSSIVQSNNGNGVESHSEKTSELAYRQYTESPPFSFHPPSSSSRNNDSQMMGYASESVNHDGEVLPSTEQSEDDDPSLASRPIYTPAQRARQATIPSSSQLNRIRIRKRSPSDARALASPGVRNKVRFNPYKKRPHFEG